MADQPRVSVIVPFYGVEDYIADTLESLQRQTLDDIEFVLVDDGSYDASIDIARRFAEQDDRFRIIRQQNQGLGPARNNGAAVARGEFITFVDSDDVVAPRAYELMVRSLDETGSDFAAANVHRFWKRGTSTQSWTHRAAFGQTRKATHIHHVSELVLDRMAWNKLWRRSFWDHHGFAFPPIRYEDYPVTLKAHLVATKVDILSDVVYFWRDRASGTSITQQAHEVGNMRDRMRSNHLVLDLLEPRREPVIERLLHDNFIDVDLVAIAKGLAGVSLETAVQEFPAVQALGQRIAPRMGRTPAASDQIHQAILSGDLEAVRAISEAQQLSPKAEADEGGRLRAMSQTWRRGVTKTATKALDIRRRKLRVHVESIQSSPTGVDIRVRPLFPAMLKDQATAQAFLTGKYSAKLPVSTKRDSSGTASTWTIHLDRGIRQLNPDNRFGYGLRFVVDTGPVRWEGPLMFTNEDCPGAIWMDEYGGLQFGTEPSAEFQCPVLKLIPLGESMESAHVQVEGTDLVVHVPGLAAVEQADLLLAAKEMEPAKYPLEDGVARVDLIELERAVPDDNPVTRSGFRQLIVELPQQPHIELTLGSPMGEAVVGDHKWSLKNSRWGILELHRRPAFDPDEAKSTDPVYAPR